VLFEKISEGLFAIAERNHFISRERVWGYWRTHTTTRDTQQMT